MISKGVKKQGGKMELKFGPAKIYLETQQHQNCDTYFWSFGFDEFAFKAQYILLKY